MKSARPHVFLICLIAIFVGGCASDVANRYYVAEKFPPRNPNEVQLLWERPQREFTVIADFQSRGESPEAMRKRAAKIGADAVIVSILGGLYDTREQWAGQDRKSHTYSRITGTALKFK